jgi:hypothetical protein
MYLAENKKILHHWKKGKQRIKTSGTDNQPELICKYPTYVEHTVYHNSPTEQETCLEFYCLKPYETKPLIWNKNPAAAVVRTNIILIASSTLKRVNILPTRVGTEFGYKRDRYIAEALFFVKPYVSSYKRTCMGTFLSYYRKTSIPINKEKCFVRT